MTPIARLGISLVILSTGCNDPPAGPTAADAVGTYVASSIEVIDYDYIFPATGAQLSLTLGPDFALAGRFTVPASDTHDQTPIDIDLQGWWELLGETIVIHPGSPSPFSSLAVTWHGDTLRFAVETRGNTAECLCRWAYRVVLVRS